MNSLVQLNMYFPSSQLYKGNSANFTHEDQFTPSDEFSVTVCGCLPGSDGSMIHNLYFQF